MEESLWKYCYECLEKELQEKEFNTWIRPLQLKNETPKEITLLAPNQFVLETINNKYLEEFQSILSKTTKRQSHQIKIEIGNQLDKDDLPSTTSTTKEAKDYNFYKNRPLINKELNFKNFIEGKSNQLARAAALQVAESPGKAYNPLFIYGEVGVGKTHLMHAIGWSVLGKNPKSRVSYLHSERFVNDMITGLRQNRINAFKEHYRSLDVLLIDDIQFFAGKERSQEEFFHTFNTLLEGHHQIILTCDRFPKEVDGLEERLKSRFSWGLTVSIDRPELETRVAILNEKSPLSLPHEVAFFIAKWFRSNVRQLEGALNRVVAFSNLTGQPITIETTKSALQDMLLLQERHVSIENIQKTTAGYYKMRLSDLLSKRRSRSIARPRQMAMTLSKDLTQHSLPEIGDAFGGRDHATVLHSYRKINELKKKDLKISEDYKTLFNLLTN